MIELSNKQLQLVSGGFEARPMNGFDFIAMTVGGTLMSAIVMQSLSTAGIGNLAFLDLSPGVAVAISTASQAIGMLLGYAGSSYIHHINVTYDKNTVA